MDNKNIQLANSLDTSTQNILQTAGKFSDEMFNKKPTPAHWSAAEVLEHLYRAEVGVPKIMWGKTVGAERPADEKSALFKKAFLESDQRYQAPDIAIPKNQFSRDELTQKFRANREHLISMLRKDGFKLNRICKEADHPVFGTLTRLEWIEFIILHSDRHLKQMNKVFEHIQ